MKTKIVIVDYGLGNIRSAQNSIQRALDINNIQGTVECSSSYKSFYNASHIILPGQGAFESCIQGLKNLDGVIEELNKQITVIKKPILGICVGMQLLADKSFENGIHKGLGWIPGNIVKINYKNLILPHMGWNRIINFKSHKILSGVSKKHFYFVHSYYFKAKNKKNVIAYANYGFEFPVVVACENIIGTQFHPEKSSDAGIKLLSNFLLM